MTILRRLLYDDVTGLRERAPALYRVLAAARGLVAMRLVARRRPELHSALATAALSRATRAELATAIARMPRTVERKGVEGDVVFASLASPDLVKHALGLRRARPDLRLALVCCAAHHVEELVHRVFDEVVEAPGSAGVIDVLSRSTASCLVLRTRAPVELFWAATRWPGRLVYCPPGFFLESIPDPLPAPEQGVSFANRQEVERLLLTKAGGAVHFLSESAVDEMRGRGVPIPRDTLTVYAGITPELEPRRLRKLSEADGAIHVVHATGVAPPGADRSTAGYAMHHLKWPTILDQGIHVHAYFSHIDYDDPQWRVYFELAERYPNFHMERQLPFAELEEALTGYDWALKHWDMRGRRVIPEHMDHLTTNFFAYLQARLPMIVSPTMGLETSAVADLGIGVVVDEDELPELRRILEGVDRSTMLAALERACELYRYDDAAVATAILGTSDGPSTDGQ